MENKGRGIDEIIQQAMREGAFDNLSGKGKPLNLDENPHLDPEWQMAYHLLKQNGFAPDFIERRQLIENDLAQARSRLARSWGWRKSELGKPNPNTAWVEVEWQKAQDTFKQTVESLNKTVLSYNLSIPSPNFHRKKIDLEGEITKITAEE